MAAPGPGPDHKQHQTEPSTAILRAARAGQLQAVCDLLDSGTITDINTSNSNGLNSLHLAGKEGHVEVVQELLKRGALVDAITKKGNTALHIAALAGQEAATKALLAAGAAPDAQSSAGFTPLYMAAQEGHAACVRLLLNGGASQSLATEDGFTPLAVAMQQGHDRVVAELLESDAKGKVRLPALHIAAKKDDVKAATLLLENSHDPDSCSKSGFTPLHIAAHYGNTAVATVLKERGADVNHAAKHSITPLHVASKWGQTPMVDLLIENGANIGAITRDGLTPLHCAARSGHAAVVSRLLKQGAPIACKTKNGLTPLHMSVQGEHVEVARALLSAGAPIDDVTVDYLTALHVAAHCGHVKVAKLLLDRNADANARALNGFTPLHIACKKSRLRVVELLLKYGANIAATTESGLTPLHVAAFMGCLNVAIHLVQQGAPADRATARGETPLHLAARAQQTDLIRVLLRNGAQVDARAREEQTALHVAARLGHADIASLLLQHGAAVEARTKDAYTPLHIASKEGKEEVAAILLEHGASVSSQTRKSFTPLHLASKYGRGGTARLLVKQGAEVDACGKNNITPLHMATYYGHPDIALLLLEKGASPHSLAKNGHSALHVACRHNHPDIAFALLEHGADPCVKSRAGFTALHMAAQEGHADCVEMLLDRQANVNDQANNGLTPLHLAAQEGRANAAAAILNAGAEIDARTHDGYTPLHVASHFGQHAVVRLLLDNNAAVHSTTSIGYTPLHQAAQQGHTLVIHMLLKSKADPNALTSSGQTACGVADRLGYIGVVEALRPVTEHTVSQAAGDTGGGPEGRYRVAAPELMQDTFMSDSEDEGGEVECLAQQQQQYRYMREAERGREITDSLPIIASVNNVNIDREPLHIGFLASFIVDARGGAMRSARRAGLAVVVPPGAVSQPTRITCRHARRALVHPPPLMEGEALAARVLQLAPSQASFLSPVVLEVPTFTSECRERELVILRSDTGDTWQDHYIHNIDNRMIQDALAKDKLEGESGGEKIARIVTCDFPQYFAVMSRVRQEMHIIGPEGGTISSSAIPQVQAQFPPAALTKRIRVGLQAQAPVEGPLKRLLGRASSASPVLTVEPRRRKFHKDIILTMPLPPTAQQNQGGSGSSLRLLCSIMGGQSIAVWEDVTGTTPLTHTGDCVSFTTSVSARFWLIDCRSISDATKLATELYKEMLLVPFEARFTVLGKRVDALEGRLLVLCLTDQQLGKTLIEQEHYTELAQSSPVTLLDSKTLYLEFSGNLLPVTKAGTQLNFKFEAFKDNRCEFSVRMKDPEDLAACRIFFMTEPKVSRGEAPATAACALDVQLPRTIAPRGAKSNLDCLNLDQSGFDALNDELSNNWGDSLGRNVHLSLPRHADIYSDGDEKLQINGKPDLIINNNGIKPAKDQLNKKVKANGQITIMQNGSDSDSDFKPVMKNNKPAMEIFDSDDDKTSARSTIEKPKRKSPPSDKEKSPEIKIDNKHDLPEKSEVEKSPSHETKEPVIPQEEHTTQPKIIDEDLLNKMEDIFQNLAQPKSAIEKEKIINDVSKTSQDLNKNLDDTREEVHEVFFKTEKKARNADNIIDDAEESLKSKMSDFNVEIDMQSNKIMDLSSDVSDSCKRFGDDIIEASEALKCDFPEKSVKPDLITELDIDEQDLLSKQFDKLSGNINEAENLMKEQYDSNMQDFNEKTESFKDHMQENYASQLENLEEAQESLAQKAIDESKVFGSTINEGFNYIVEEFDDGQDYLQSVADKQIDNLVSSGEYVENLKDDIASDAQNVKSNIEEYVTDKDAEIREQFNQTVSDSNQAFTDLKDDVSNSILDKKDSLVKDCEENFNSVKSDITSKGEEVSAQIGDSFNNTTQELSREADSALQEAYNLREKGESFVGEGIADIKNNANEAEEYLKKEASSKVDELNNFGDNLKNEFDNKTSELSRNITDVKESVGNEFNNFSNNLNEKKEAYSAEAEHKLDELADEFKSKKESFNNEIDEKLNDASDYVGDVTKSIENKTSDITESLNEKGNAINQGIDDSLNKFSDNAKETGESIGHAIDNKTEELAASLSQAQDQAKQFAGKAKDFSVGKIPGFKKSKGNKGKK